MFYKYLALVPKPCRLPTMSWKHRHIFSLGYSSKIDATCMFRYDTERASFSSQIIELRIYLGPTVKDELLIKMRSVLEVLV